MRHRLFSALFLVTILAWTALAWAGPTPTPTQIPEGDVMGAMGLVPKVIEAFKAGDHPTSIGFVLMLLVWATRSFAWKKLHKSVIPTATILMTTMGFTGASMVAGMDPVQATFAGVNTGLATIGLWEWLGKPFRKWLDKRKAKT